MTPENLAKLKEQYWPLAPSLMLELIEDYERLQAENEQLKEELKITNKLLETRMKALNLIPECPMHGPGCVAHAIEWITKMKEWGNYEK